MSCGSIYKIQFPNGKHYIGQTTTSLEQRTKEHKCCAKSGDTKCLYNAIRKYDIVDTFELIEIDTADTLEELCEKEKKYITEYNSYYINGNGYNMTRGGEGINGYVFTEDVKQKMSKKRIQYFKDNSEAREKCSKAQNKRFENPQARKQHSEIKKKFFDENPNAGKEHSKRLKKYFEDNPEAREKNSEAQKKRFKNPEARERLREISKKNWENPEARQKQSERMKKYYEDNPEAREKNSEAQKNR